MISEADLASIGGSRHSEPRQTVLDSQSDRTKTYSPSSNSGGSSLAAFLDYWPCWDYLPIWLQEVFIGKVLLLLLVNMEALAWSYGTRKETLRGGTSSLIAPER